MIKSSKISSNNPTEVSNHCD